MTWRHKSSTHGPFYGEDVCQFVKYKHTPTKKGMKGRPVGGPALKAGLGRGPLVHLPLGDHRDPVVCWTKPFGEHVQVPFRLSKRARRESGVTAV